LTFDFPEGSLIGIAKEKLPVNVTFTGSRPTSFTANVVFLDEEGKRFSLPVTGTTDASLLTIKPFMDVSNDPHFKVTCVIFLCLELMILLYFAIAELTFLVPPLLQLAFFCTDISA